MSKSRRGKFRVQGGGRRTANNANQHQPQPDPQQRPKQELPMHSTAGIKKRPVPAKLPNKTPQHAARTPTATALSAHVSSDVLKMRFMQKTMVKVDAERRESEKRQREEEVWQRRDVEPEAAKSIYPAVQKIDDEPDCTIGTYRVEERFTVLEELKFGRVSYRGQNAEVEKLMIFHECKRLGLEPPPEEKPTGAAEQLLERRALEEGQLLDDSDQDGCDDGGGGNTYNF